MASGNENWAAWLQKEMDKRRVKTADLVSKSEGQVGRYLFSKWLRSQQGVTPAMAIQVAKLLGASPIDALRAGGHHDIADAVAIASRASGADPAAPAVERIARVVEEITAMEHLSPEIRQRLISRFYSTLEQAARMAVEQAQDMEAFAVTSVENRE